MTRRAPGWLALLLVACGGAGPDMDAGALPGDGGSAGARLARAARTRHELVYRFLLALGVSPRVAATDAEGIEHHVSRETLRCLQKYLDRAS